MELSPLELYQKAYKLHYGEKKVDEACAIYQQLLRDHPDSDVAAYASVQMRSVQPEKKPTPSSPRPGSGPHPVVAVLLVINLLAVTAAAVWQFVSLRTVEERLNEQAVLSRALGQITTGNDAEALKLLDRLKALMPQDITPFALAADVYRRNHKYTAARREYELYQRLNPDSPSLSSRIERIIREEDAWTAKNKRRRARAVDEAERKRVRRAPRRPTRKPDEGKPKLLVDPNELQFF
jgi:tetratricopeptide (TPR) repeat protein